MVNSRELRLFDGVHNRRGRANSQIVLWWRRWTSRSANLKQKSDLRMPKRGGVPMRDGKILDNCLMDSDATANIRATHRRQRAVVIALATEAALVVGLALWPMVTTGSAPTEIVMLPRIPYRGSDAPKPETAQQRTPSARLQQINRILLQPQRIPPRVETSSSRAVDVAPPVFGESGPGVGSNQTGISFATGNDASMIPRPRPSSSRIIHQSEAMQSGLSFIKWTRAIRSLR